MPGIELGSKMRRRQRRHSTYPTLVGKTDKENVVWVWGPREGRRAADKAVVIERMEHNGLLSLVKRFGHHLMASKGF